MEMNYDREYIDMDEALSRIGGNVALYKKLLGRFVESSPFEDLKRVIDSGDRDEALRQAHSLKGVSANLSLVKIRASTIQLEELLKENADCSACLGELERAFSTTMAEIMRILE